MDSVASRMFWVRFGATVLMFCSATLSSSSSSFATTRAGKTQAQSKNPKSVTKKSLSECTLLENKLNLAMMAYQSSRAEGAQIVREGKPGEFGEMPQTENYLDTVLSIVQRISQKQQEANRIWGKLSQGSLSVESFIELRKARQEACIDTQKFAWEILLIFYGQDPSSGRLADVQRALRTDLLAKEAVFQSVSLIELKLDIISKVQEMRLWDFDSKQRRTLLEIKSAFYEEAPKDQQNPVITALLESHVKRTAPPSAENLKKAFFADRERAIRYSERLSQWIDTVKD